MMKLNPLHRGFSIIEVLVAILVLALGILAVVKLQGVLIQSASDSNHRAVAVSLAQQKIDDLRSFTNSAEFRAIEDNLGGDIPATGAAVFSHSATENAGDSNIVYSLNWGVENYFNDVPAASPVQRIPNAGETPDFKLVNVFVAWEDEIGALQQVTLETIIDSYPPGLTSASAQPSPGGDPPSVSYTPSSDPQVVPIGVGEGTKRETLVPTTSTVDGYARTAFVANTYRPDPDNPTGPGELLRQEEFTTVACNCRFDGTSAGSYAVSHAVWGDGVFVGNSASYKDVRGEFVEGKVAGCVEDKGQCDAKPDPLCEICCRDHHDKTGLSRKYDPYRAGVPDGFGGGGNHEHHLGTETVVTSGEYLESCRMKRVDGIWRVYQDWHLIDLTVLPLADLINNDIRDAYASYVADLVSAYIDAAGVDGSAEALPLAIPSILPAKTGVPAYDTGNKFVEVAPGTRSELVARAVYVDYIDPKHLEEVKKLKDDKKDFLLHVPFYEVDITPIVAWSSDVPAALRVGPYDAPGSASDLIAGELEALGTNPEAVPVVGMVRHSNSGLVALSQAVDFLASANPDDQTVSREVHVCVDCTAGVDPTSCKLPWGGSIASGDSRTAFEYEYGNMEQCQVSQSRTCNSGILSGTYQYEGCTEGPPPPPPPATCETTVTGNNIKKDTISIAVFNETDTVIAGPWDCKVTNEKYTCSPVTSVVDAIIGLTRTTSAGSVDGPIVSGTCGPRIVDFQ